MGFLRNIVILGLGYFAVKTVQRMVANAEKQQEKVRAKSDEQAGRIPTLRPDPVTGVYRPEA